VGANSGDRIFSLLSEPSPNAAGAQGLGGFSAQGASRRVIVLTGVLLGPADESDRMRRREFVTLIGGVDAEPFQSRHAFAILLVRAAVSEG
jgi:hypothetical protein